MKYVRYLHNNVISYGINENDKIIEIEGSIFSTYKLTGLTVNLAEVKVLAPVIPSKIIPLGYNYKDLVGHQKNYHEPIIFLKPNSSVIGCSDYIEISEKLRTWTEVELAIVIGKNAKKISSQKASEYIFGYTIGNDVTVENILGRDHHLARSKAWDTFCPLGPHIETELNTDNLVLTNKINGVVHQESNTNKRILNDHEIVSLVSNLMTLYPGDVILTGTPANAESSIIHDQDVVTLEIENIGTLTNKVRFIS